LGKKKINIVRCGGNIMNLIERVLVKFTSGRFILTIAASIVFIYLSINEILPIDRVMEIILIIIYAYFSRPRLNGYEANDNDNIQPSKTDSNPDKTDKTDKTDNK